MFDLDCEWQNMGEAIALANRHPELQVVLEHIGFPRSRDDEYFGNWQRSMRELASAGNVTCKISGLAMTDPNFTKDSLRRWVEGCVEAFGPDRCVLGSNWPVDRLYSSYDAIMDLYREYLGSLSESEQAKVLSENANRIYRVL
jgi:predicted TIM-barrel fold metal-dependent hydrolase